MCKKIKVIVYPYFYEVGGIARYLASFIDSLQVGSGENVLLTAGNSTGSKFLNGVEIIDLPLGSGRLGLLYWGLSVRKKILDLDRVRGVSLVNFHYPPMITGLMLPKSIRVILTTHTTYYGMSGMYSGLGEEASDWSRTSVFLKMFLERLILIKSTASIVLTPQGVSELEFYGYSKPIRIIPNGVDLAEFSATNNQNKSIDILICGRIEIRKGSKGIVEFCRKISSQNPLVSIVIVGHGSDYQYVSESLEDLENVSMTGRVPMDVVKSYYEKSKIYVSLSYYEGLPGTCLESMAMGVPVICWDLPFYRGLIDSGTNGFLIPVNKFDAMIKMAFELLKDSRYRKQLGVAARDKVSKSYNWSCLSSDIVEFLEGIDQ